MLYHTQHFVQDEQSQRQTLTVHKVDSDTGGFWGGVSTETGTLCTAPLRRLEQIRRPDAHPEHKVDLGHQSVFRGAEYPPETLFARLVVSQFAIGEEHG